VFDEDNKGNYTANDSNDWNGGMTDVSTLKSTGKSAKKRRSGVVVEEGEDAEEDDEEEDDGVGARGPLFLSWFAPTSRVLDE
jgi:hypothetical protein